MEKVIINYEPSADKYIVDLIDVLFAKEYFGFKVDAQNYAMKIADFIKSNIVTFPHKETPEQLHSFGAKYIFYKANQRTTWYIFFEQDRNHFLITNIINSHSPEARYL